MRLVRVITGVFVLLLCMSGSLLAQVLYGTLVGNVTDPTQGAVVGATVTLSSKSPGLWRDTKSDERGSYEFSNVQAGNYTVKIAAPGFSSFEASDIPVSVNTVSRVDAAMKVGAVSESVVVGAELVALQTDKTDVNKEISTREIT